MSTDAAPHMTAWLALLNAELGTMTPPRVAYEYDEAPQAGGDYVIAFLTRTSGGATRTIGGLVTSTWRLQIRVVGVGVNNARVLLDRANGVVDGAHITVGGRISTPVEFQTDDPIRQDEQYADLWSGLRSYTYAL